jgi:exopolysaccharide biosynthesis polyprenyl glycosylphosphotransferase
VLPPTTPVRRGRGRSRPRPTRGFAALLLGGDLAALVAVSAVLGPPIDAAQALLLALAVAGWTRARLYRCRCSLSLLDDLPRLFAALFAATGAAAVLAWLIGSGARDGDVAALAVGSAIAVPLVRALTYAVARSLRRRGVLVRRAVVVGTDKIGQRLAHDLGRHREYGLRVVGFVNGSIPGDRVLPMPLLGDGAGPLHCGIDSDVDVVVAAFGAMPETDLVDLLRRCRDLGREVYLVPRLPELHQDAAPGDRVWRVPLVHLPPPAYHRGSWRIKRMLDVVLAGVALVVLAPLLLVTALSVRLWVGRPVIFRQERVGHGGRPFTLLKFQSLHPIDETESRTRWNIANDQRLGTVGRILRATSLDELPQLVNILRGDMSIVGPRPERPFFAEQFAREVRRYDDRHRVPVGLTGWAAVHGLRGDTSIEERADFDNFYIENWSLWRDVTVVLRTLPTLIRRGEPASAAAGSDPSIGPTSELPAPRSSADATHTRLNPRRA